MRFIPLEEVDEAIPPSSPPDPASDLYISYGIGFGFISYVLIKLAVASLARFPPAVCYSDPFTLAFLVPQ